MTDEELDLLASGYLDGEATPEEVAMIERDPALLARVEELRAAQSAVRAPVPGPSMGLKEDQLAAALAAFDVTDRRTTVMAVDPTSVLPEAGEDAEAGEGAEAGEDAEATEIAEPVIDLRSRRAEREQRRAEAAGRMRWLSAVAGVLVFAAGAVFLIGQVNGGGDDGEFAGDVPAADTAATESAEAQLAPAGDDTAADVANADDGAEASADIASEAMAADAEEEFSVEDAADGSSDEAADPADSAASEPTIRELAEEGFFGDEPVASYARIPTSDELLAELDLPWRDPEAAMCAVRAELPAGAEVIGYLPIEIPAADNGSDASATRVVEALYLTVKNESQVILVDPDTCDTV